MRKTLIVILALSAALEALITVLIFAKPEVEAAQFGVLQITPDVLFLAHVLGCFTTLFSVILALAAFDVARDNPRGRLMAAVAGVFWVFTGIVIYSHTSKPEFLALDTARGVVLLALCGLLRNRTSAAP